MTKIDKTIKKKLENYELNLDFDIEKLIEEHGFILNGTNPTSLVYLTSFKEERNPISVTISFNIYKQEGDLYSILQCLYMNGTEANNPLLEGTPERVLHEIYSKLDELVSIGAVHSKSKKVEKEIG